MNHLFLGSALALSISLVGCSSVPLDVGQPSNIMRPSQSLPEPYSIHDSVTVSASGFIWDSCNSIARKAIDKAQATIAADGATHMIDAQWSKESSFTKSPMPTCNTRWYSVLAFGIGLASPWSRGATVSGTIVNKDNSAISDSASTHPDAMYPEAAHNPEQESPSTEKTVASSETTENSDEREPIPANPKAPGQERTSRDSRPFTDLIYWENKWRR